MISITPASSGPNRYRDCIDDTHWLNYVAATGKLQNNVPGGHRLTEAIVTGRAASGPYPSSQFRGRGHAEASPARRRPRAVLLVTASPAFAGGGAGGQCAGRLHLSPSSPGQRAAPARERRRQPRPGAGRASGGAALTRRRDGHLGRYVGPSATRGPASSPASPAGRPAVAGAAVPARRFLRGQPKHLALQSPLIEASPPVGLDQLVNVPTWLWLAGPWTSVHATAAVPGVSVTATAVPQLVTWRMGDGSVVVCHGPGTPFGSGTTRPRRRRRAGTPTGKARRRAGRRVHGERDDHLERDLGGRRR